MMIAVFSEASGGILPRTVFALMLSLGLGAALSSQCAETNEPGLIITFKSAANPSAVDAAAAPSVSLFVQEGKPPSPFLPGGKFTATWDGYVSAELRSEFSFQAELNGQLKLEINEKPAYEADSSSAPLSKPVQLNKEANTLRVIYSSANKGDSFLRLWWTEKPPFTSPIPLAVLTHESTAELKSSLQRHLGRELFLEHRCINCHKMAESTAAKSAIRNPQSAIENPAVSPELALDAPSFEGIGARRNVDWMVGWILDPKATRASVHMPKVFTGPNARANAEAIASHLATLKTGGEVSIPEPKIKSKPSNLAGTESNGDQNEPQKSLLDKLHCVGCHNGPDENDPGKINLKHVAQKFPPGKLAEFLRAPEAHFASTRMPNFHLSTKEAAELADFLLSKTDKPRTTPSAIRDANEGQKLVQETGCLNCHKANLENKFSAPNLATLTPARWTHGCLADEATATGKAPQFAFTAEERNALRAFGQTDRQSLTRHVPAEFAERQTRLLNCTRCHGQVEGFPPLEILGGKLKPEWAAKFIAGEILYKPRTERHPHGEPWLEMRMPAFKSRATLLADGLAAQQGYPPHSAPEPPINRELAKIGQKLVGKEGGFSCISCHGVGNLEAMEVFEGEGINFVYASDRLLPQYYRRWMRNPLSIDPQTKMPAYFDEGKSPLTDVLEGDAEKQTDAVWQYLRLGPKMPPPSTGQ